MKIAVLHWSTSSVGGINTSLETYHAEAEKRGDTFHVFACNNQASKSPVLFDSRKMVRGGDTKITIDGELPHHEKNYRESVKFLLKNKYDVVMTSFLCPHPTKAYGTEPVFTNILSAINKVGIPLIGYIHDAYWESYKEFGEIALQYMETTVLNQKAYSSYFDQYTDQSFVHGFVPFTPLGDIDTSIKRVPKKTVWLPQWKNIKGIHKFWEGMEHSQQLNIPVELYSNGIEYYYIRAEDSWKKYVGKDHYDDAYSGNGSYPFFGFVPTSEISKILLSSEFMCDFQGHSAKYEAYLNGSYNHTILEALYYGAVPVVHTNMLKSSIPKELLLAIPDVANWAKHVNEFQYGDFDTSLGREYILDCHNISKLYDMVFSPFKEKYTPTIKSVKDISIKEEPTSGSIF